MPHAIQNVTLHLHVIATVVLLEYLSLYSLPRYIRVSGELGSAHIKLSLINFDLVNPSGVLSLTIPDTYPRHTRNVSPGMSAQGPWRAWLLSVLP